MTSTHKLFTSRRLSRLFIRLAWYLDSKACNLCGEKLSDCPNCGRWCINCDPDRQCKWPERSNYYKPLQ